MRRKLIGGIVAVFALVVWTLIQPKSLRITQVQAETFALLHMIHKGVQPDNCPRSPTTGIVRILELSGEISEPRLQECVRGAHIVDTWGNPLVLVRQGNTVEIWSCGSNGIDENGYGDDIFSRDGRSIIR